MFAAKNIRVQIGAKKILDEVSLKINSGEVIALFSANLGADLGKTE